MKKMNKIIPLLLSGLLSMNLTAQKDCTVMKSEIAGSYTGKCKNGLAQGKGKAAGEVS